MHDIVTPRHIAFIPDGNRRWAKEQGLPTWKGHEKGKDRFEEVLEACFAEGVSHVTFWAASTDNLIKRSKIEVSALIRILSEVLSRLLDNAEVKKQQVRVRIIGKWKECLGGDSKLNRLIEKIEKLTENHSKKFLTVLFGYDGREEMLDAVNQLKDQAHVSFETFQSKLWTGHLPPVDLVIRTGGEPHWSAGFMMWLTANSQFYFTPKLWPEFSKSELQLAIESFKSRGRRFGK